MVLCAGFSSDGWLKGGPNELGPYGSWFMYSATEVAALGACAGLYVRANNQSGSECGRGRLALSTAHQLCSASSSEATAHMLSRRR